MPFGDFIGTDFTGLIGINVEYANEKIQFLFCLINCNVLKTEIVRLEKTYEKNKTNFAFFNPVVHFMQKKYRQGNEGISF